MRGSISNCLCIIIYITFISAHTLHCCNVTDKATGKFYDLSSLKRPENEGHYIYNGNYTFRINVCGRIVANNETFLDQDVSCYQYDSHAKMGWICGREKTKLLIKDEYLMLLYTHGDYCDPEEKSLPRQMHVLLICDKYGSKENPGKPVFISESRCIYSLAWKTFAACPINNSDTAPEKGDGNGPSPVPPPYRDVLRKDRVSGILVLGLLYFVIGYAYNTFVLRERGWNRVPNIDFWRGLWEYMNSFRRRGTLAPSSAGYSRIPDSDRLIEPI